MSGSVIQPIGSPSTPAAAPSAAVAGVRTAGSGAQPVQPAMPVALEFSQLAQTLEKLAQASGADARTLAQLMSMVQEQGSLLELLGAANAGKPMPNSATPNMTGGIPIPPQSNPATPSTPATSPQSPNEIANWARNFIASIKENLGPLLEISTAASAAKAATGPDAPASLKAALAQLVQSQTEQISTIFKQIGDGLGLTTKPLAQTGMMAAQVSAVPAGAGPEAPDAAPGIPAAARLAAALSQLQASVKPSENPLIRTEFIRATLGVVATLLNEPVFGESPARRAVSAAARRQAPPAAPEPEAAPIDPLLRDRVQAVLKELGNLRPLMTAGGRDTWSRVESLLDEIRGTEEVPGGAKPAKVPPRVAEAARRGVTFEVEMRESSRLNTAVAELRQKGITVEVLYGARAKATVRVTIPGSDTNAEPVRVGVMSLDAAGEQDAAGKAINRPPQSALAAVQAQAAAMADTPASTAALSILTASSMPSTSSAQSASGDAASNPATQPRLDQYSHLEAFRMNVPPRQEAAVCGIAAFFQARRGTALGGSNFDPAKEERADKRILATDRLLEYKPIEVIKPESRGKQKEDQKDKAAGSGTVDLKPVHVSRK